MNGLRFGILHELEVRGRSQAAERTMFANVVEQARLADELGYESTFTYRSTCTSARIAQGSPFTRGAASCDGFAHPVSTSAFAHSSNAHSLPHGFDSITLAPTAEWPCSVAPKVFRHRSPPTGLSSCC